MPAPEPGTEVDTRAFRDALGSFATGVTIVTTRDGDHDVGLTANSFNSVSLDPPMVLWSLAKHSHSLPAFMRAEFFAVHILAADQEALSNRFAKRGADKFGGMAVERGHGGVPLLNDCSVRFECRTAFRYEGGDHQIFVGEVISFEHFHRPPLIFHAGAYALAVSKPRSIPAAKETRETDGSFGHSSLRYLLGLAHTQMSLKVLPALAEYGMDESESFALTLLGMEDNRTVEELDATIRLAGGCVTPEVIARLVDKALVDSDCPVHSHSAVRLTRRGQHVLVQLAAAAKSVDSDAESDLDFPEVQMLKHLLKRVIRTLNPALSAAAPQRPPHGDPT